MPGLWKKLISKTPALVALCIIGLSFFIAIFAYVLAPDNSPNANTIIVELSAKKPGFTKQFLYLPKQQKQKQPSFLASCFSGTPASHTMLPINAHWQAGDKLFVSHYIDDGISDTLQYELSAIQPLTIKERTFYLGTDRYGRDILSRLLVGSRVSISVGIIAMLLSLTIGIILGSLAGYYGGKVDNIVMWLINMLWAIPTLLLVFAITLTIGKGFWEIFIAIGLTMWVSAARLIRGQVMVLREMEYITAAKAIGLRDMRIIFRHILPNIAGPVMVIAASNFAAAILTEAGLSFLGIGVQPPQPSWGLMIKEHYNFLITNRPFLAIIPGLAIMLLVFAFNILGNALRDVLDVRA